MILVGELFLGSSFGGLDLDEAPQFLNDIDKHFLLCGIEWNFPVIYAVLTLLPIPAIRDFLGARDRISQVSSGSARSCSDADQNSMVKTRTGHILRITVKTRVGKIS